MVNILISNPINPDIRNIHHLSSILYSKFISQLCANIQDNGHAIIHASKTQTTKSFNNNLRIPGTDSPNTLRIPISFFLCPVPNRTTPNTPRNAIKFTQDGNVRITAKEKNGFIEFSITDMGVGIKPEDLKKLFRLDTEFSTRGTANEKGSGLGLILCKEFVERNNGKIYVESEKGKGTSFMFKLPATSN